jgi:hypothetical protein
MAYSDFTLESAWQAFSLGLDVGTNLFHAIPSIRAGARLRSWLDDYVPMATSIHTEKARSEFIVAPILGEVRLLMDQNVSLFSGVNFEVDRTRGLDGICDFIFSRSNNQLFVTRPVMMIVEAKNDNIKSGLGQCAAEMVAARLFNSRQGDGLATIHGAVTTGSVWKFLKLEEDTLFADHPEYYLDQVDKILGILLHCVGGDPATVGAAA